MTRRLARTVIVRDDAGAAVALGPSDDVPDWAVAQITNPLVWDVGDPPGIEQLMRVGATVEELDALRTVWASVTDEQRADALDGYEPDDQTDEEAFADLETARVEARERGMSFADALRWALDHLEGDEDIDLRDGGTPAAPASPVEVASAEVESLAPPSGVTVEPIEMPARNASKAAWLAFAVSIGADPEQAAEKTRDELADLYGD